MYAIFAEIKLAAVQNFFIFANNIFIIEQHNTSVQNVVQQQHRWRIRAFGHQSRHQHVCVKNSIESSHCAAVFLTCRACRISSLMSSSVISELPFNSLIRLIEAIAARALRRTVCCDVLYSINNASTCLCNQAVISVSFANDRLVRCTSSSFNVRLYIHIVLSSLLLIFATFRCKVTAFF